MSPLMLQMGDRLLNREFAHVPGVSITKETAFAMGVGEQLVTDDLLNAPMDVVAAYWEGYTDTSVLTPMPLPDHHQSVRITNDLKPCRSCSRTKYSQNLMRVKPRSHWPAVACAVSSRVRGEAPT